MSRRSPQSACRSDLVFPTEQYNRVHELVLTRGRFHVGLQSQWAAAWNAVGFRYDGLRAHDDAYRSALAQAPDNPQRRAVEERELFGFFVSAASLFECCGYAAHALLAGCKVPGYRLRSYRAQRRVDLERLVPPLQVAFPGDKLTTGFNRLLRARQFREIQEIRNYLSHRSTPPRLIRIHVGREDPRADVWRLGIHGWPEIELGPDVTSKRLEWCSEMLGILVPRMAAFAERELPRRRSTR